MARKRSFVGEVGTWLKKWERRPGWTYYAVCHHPYRCNMLDPNHDCTEVMGYGGQTRGDGKNPDIRWDEHMYGGGRGRDKAKDWADTVIRWEIHRHGKNWSGFKLDRVERKLIIRGVPGLGRPYYNYEWNRLNPNRIPPWEAKEQRKRRDAARARRGMSGTTAAKMPRQRRTTAVRGAGVSIRRNAAGEVIGGTWFGDRGAEFRKNLIGG